MTFIGSPREAEVNAATHMRSLGFSDARITAAGADGGIDVVASGAIAQVKWKAAQTGRPDLQRLVGARGNDTGLQLLFYSGTPYSRHAQDYADTVGMALFTYNPSGAAQPVNGHARHLVDRSRERRQRQRELSGREVFEVNPGPGSAIQDEKRAKVVSVPQEGLLARLRRAFNGGR
ncbi:hypothetical protein GS896_25720 [Rhodococcus hoagii]|nr:hypothetical protein [Prescottella equi]MBM4654095.1 hypothetical protein [Prescottella equi]MBM4719569.1 hypothetical protein [Prescottella equi]NKR23368.1 hypothetical protein [Prescottella equi]NKT56021.1 hypothetical protein [Prescottella equi]